MQANHESQGPTTIASRGTMRAIVQHTYGTEEVLNLVDLALPEIEADEVLIQVHAAGVDRGVWHVMTGLPYLVRLAGFGVTRPKTPVPGLDVAGRVVAVGDDVTRFEVGDEVFGAAKGAYAEFAAAEEEKLSHKPTNVTFEQAAVTAVSGVTALQALTDVGNLEAGQRVLVIGASGGVGSYAVQIAKSLGAVVTGVASAAKGDVVRDLGADEVIDYAATDYLDGSQRYDLIIDTGGLNPVRRLRKALRRGGRLVIVGGEGGGKFTGGVGRQLRAALLSLFVPERMGTFLSTAHHRHIDRLAAHLEMGSVTPAVGKRYSLAEVPTAIADLAAGRAAGKSVIVVKDDADAS